MTSTAATEMGNYARSLQHPHTRAYALAFAEYLLGLGDRPEGSTGPENIVGAERQIRQWLRRIQRDCEIRSDADALDRIAAVLSGQEWTADTCDDIAAIVRSAGREVRDWLGGLGEAAEKETGQ